MQWNELFDYIKSHLKKKNCARTVDFLEGCASYRSDKEAYLYLSQLLAILFLGLKEKEITRLRQIYKSKLRSLKKGEINSLSESLTDIKLLSHTVGQKGSKAFMRECNRFFRKVDDKEKELLDSTIKPQDDVDLILLSYCKDKINETELLYEIYPHHQHFIQLIERKKKKLRRRLNTRKKRDRRRKIYPKDLIQVIKEFGGISHYHIWQEDEDSRYEPGTFKYVKVASDLADFKPELLVKADLKTIQRNLNKLLNKEKYYSVEKIGDIYKCVT